MYFYCKKSFSVVKEKNCKYKTKQQNQRYVSWLKNPRVTQWPCNCINTPAPGAASTAASTSPIRKEKTHTQNKNMVIYMSSIS